MVSGLLGAVRQVASLGGESPRIWSYHDDFDRLWGLEPLDGCSFFDFSDWSLYLEHLIVVWDAVPSTRVGYPVAADTYLTAFDWATALSIAAVRHYDAGGETDVFPLRITIVDIASQNYVRSPAVEFFRQFPRGVPPSLPWVRIVRPAPDRSSFAPALLTGERCNGIRFDAASVGIIRRYWTTFLATPARSGDHHAIANLVGPILLLGGAAGDRHARALAQLIFALTEQGHQHDHTSADRLAERKGLSALEAIGEDDGVPLGLVLLDDQALTGGWGGALCRAMGAAQRPADGRGSREPVLIGSNKSQSIHIYAAESPAWLKERLEGRDQRYRLDLLPHPIERTAEILLLDLRLFPGNDLAEERAFVAELLEIARHFKEGDDIAREIALPWPGFSETELDAISGWLKSGAREDANYSLVLSLFPRVVALTDLSLPIIVFSSTQQRAVLEWLKGYGSIVTTFSKPSIQQLLANRGVDVFEVGLAPALERAVQLVRARQLCRRLPTTPFVSKLVGDSRFWKLHIYLDETPGGGEQKFGVGGIIAALPPGTDNGVFESALLRYARQIRGPNGKYFCREQVSDLWNAVLESAEQNGAFVARVVIVAQRGILDAQNTALVSGDMFRDERVGDNLHRELIRRVVEVSVFQWARRRVPKGSGVSLEVYGATRHLRPTQIDEKNPERAAKAFFFEFGVDTVWTGPEKYIPEAIEVLERLKKLVEGPIFKNKELAKYVGLMAETCSLLEFRSDKLIRVFGPDALRPLVEEVVRSYDEECLGVAIDHARADPINVHGEDRARYTPLLHLLADAIVDWGEFDIQANYGQDLVSLLLAHRLALSGRIATAIIQGAIAAAAQPTDEGSLTYALAQDLGQAAYVLSGDEFCQMASDLGNERSVTPTRRIHGRVARRTDVDLVIRDGRGREYHALREYCRLFASIREGTDVTFIGKPLRRPGKYIASDVRPASL